MQPDCRNDQNVFFCNCIDILVVHWVDMNMNMSTDMSEKDRSVEIREGQIHEGVWLE